MGNPDSFCVTFSCGERQADKIRAFGQALLRKSKLKYSSGRSYPESGYNTPAFGEPIEVWFVISPPRGQAMQSTDLLRICLNLIDVINREFATDLDVTIENTDCSLNPPPGIYL